MMLTYVLQKQRTAQLIRLNLFYFLFFLGMYTLIDFFNLSYAEMATQYGLYLPMLNGLLNIVMAILSMGMIGLTTAQFQLGGKESFGSNMSFLSVIFGIFTYGCTSCVISLLAALGITLSVAVLPLAGLPYKLIALGLLIIGLIWVMISIQKTTCKVPSSPKTK